MNIEKINHGLLHQLPLSPEGKSGWPWSEESEPLPMTMADGRHWPRISIVTPSYNQGQFLEETIRSVLLQNYPNLEYIIIDGGSTDNSVEIIKKYEPWLTYWVSEKDGGQAQAISKGFNRAMGDILNWLNSDDIFLPHALREIGESFSNLPQIGLIYGNRKFINSMSEVIELQYPPAQLSEFHFAVGQHIPQESCFWRRNLYSSVGGIDVSKFFAMDYDLIVRMWKISSFKKIRKFIGCIRIHNDTKSFNYQKIMWSEFEQSKKAHSIISFGRLGVFIIFRLVRIQTCIERYLSTS